MGGFPEVVSLVNIKLHTTLQSLVCSWPRVEQQTPSTVWGRVKDISKDITELICTLSFKKCASDPVRPSILPDVTFREHGSDGRLRGGSSITQHVRHITESSSSPTHSNHSVHVQARNMNQSLR